MNRLGPYLCALAGLVLASSDTLHVGVLSDPKGEGLSSIAGLLSILVGWFWSHHSLSKSLPGRVAQWVNPDEIAKAAATAVVEQLQAPGGDLSAVVSAAAKAAAQEVSDHLVEHVRQAIANNTAASPTLPPPRGPALEELDGNPFSKSSSVDPVVQ
jgi:hypothetical protein